MGGVVGDEVRGCQRAEKNPWTRVTPAATRVSSCSRVSTPSAMISRAAPWRRALRWSSQGGRPCWSGLPIWATRERSIFRMSKLQRARTTRLRPLKVTSSRATRVP